MPFVMVAKIGLHCRLRRQLHIEVHAGVYFEPAPVELLFTIGVFEIAPDLFGEVGRVGNVLVDAGADIKLFGFGLV